MRIVLLGAPGAGKGTQAKMIAEKFKIPHISTGDMFRAITQENSVLGKEVKQCLDSGTLVSDELTVQVVKERISKKDCKKGFILDGFPRTIAQAAALEALFASFRAHLDAVLYFYVDDNVLIKRLSGRWMCKCGAVYHLLNNIPKKTGICDKCGSRLYQRDDDNERTARKRIVVYRKQTEPLIDYYSGKGSLIKINADQAINVVFKDVVDALNKEIA